MHSFNNLILITKIIYLANEAEKKLINNDYESSINIYENIEEICNINELKLPVEILIAYARTIVRKDKKKAYEIAMNSLKKLELDGKYVKKIFLKDYLSYVCKLIIYKTSDFIGNMAIKEMLAINIFYKDLVFEKIPKKILNKFFLDKNYCINFDCYVFHIMKNK